MFSLVDVQVVLKSDVRDSAEESRAFFFDNTTNTLTNTLIRNITFKRGELVPLQQKLFFSIEVRFFVCFSSHIHKNLIYRNL